MYRFTAALLFSVLSIGAAHAKGEGCSPEREQRLLTHTFYNEGVMTREAHASVMAVVLNRLKSGKYGKTICSVLTFPGAFVTKAPQGKVYPNKLQMSGESALIFRDEYHGQGNIQTKAQVFQLVGNRDSFVAARSRRHAKEKYITIGDNSFYKAGSMN